MASLGSVPFVIDTATETQVVLHSGKFYHRRSKLPFFAYRPRKTVLDCRGFGGLKSQVGGVADNAGGSGGGGGRLVKIKRLKATGGSGGSSEDGEESDDTLQVTIEKSKKILAMQRDLLQQIAERREIISSIKSTIISPEGDPLSSEEGNGSFLNLDSASSDEGDNSNIPSSSSSRLVVNQSPETPINLPAVNQLRGNPPSTVSKQLGEDKKPGLGLPFDVDIRKQENPNATKTHPVVNQEQGKPPTTHTVVNQLPGTPSPTPPLSNQLGEDKKHGLDLPQNSAVVDFRKQREQATSDSARSNGLPPFESDVSATYAKHEDCNEPTLQDANVEANVPTSDDLKPPPLAGANVMNVILVAAECAPWVKTGGLGDVAGALPKALARRGHRVMVVVPRYGNYAEPQDTGIRRRYKVDGQDMEVTYFQAYIDGVDFVFVESPMFRNIENNIYGGNRMDILKRMVLFCKAAIEVPWYVPCGGICYGDGNLAFIANDWHTALLPVYLKAYYRDHGLMKYTRSILVIHNIAHQGRGPVDDFSYVDLPPHYLDLFRMYDPVGGEHFNIFAAGLKAADRVVTVSHGYAGELKTSKGGWGLHDIINANDWKLRGIINGIDTRDWNPQVDTHLKSDGYSNYSLETLHTGKPQCKAALQRELGLPVREDVPLIGFIGRLDQQKGIDLIAEAIPWMMGQDVQLVMLGTGRPDLEQMLRHFESQHNDKIRGWVGFSVKTAHRITAGADILLMPSRFEPCGLNQLYAMSYGTVPVVHAVGGLRDTVQPFDPYNEFGLGWTFYRAEASQLIHALGNCLLTYREYRQSWEGIQRRGMMQDLSWDNAAHIYEEVLVAAKYQW